MTIIQVVKEFLVSTEHLALYTVHNHLPTLMIVLWDITPCSLEVDRRFRNAYCVHIIEERKVYKVMVGKPEGKIPLERPRRRWEDGIRMDLRERGWGWIGFDWLSIGTGDELL
jgi:hypothetical protein